MRKMMKGHLDRTLSEAVNRLTGKHADDVRDYDAIHAYILMMADGLSQGIIKKFPKRLSLNEASAFEPGDAAASPGSCLAFCCRASLGQWLDRPL